MSIDIDAANKLLQKKYEEGPASATSSIGNMIFGPLSNTAKETPKPPKFANNPSDWQMIAQNYLQMLEQMRDEAHAWNEAYLEEKKRSDRLEARLFDVLNLNQDNIEVREEKINIQSPEQVNRRRANFPTMRKIYEDAHRVVENDAS